MKRTPLSCAALLVMLISAGHTLADIARPKATPSPVKEGKIVLHTGLIVVPDANVYEARLQISQDGLQSLREALATAQVNPSMGQQIALSSTRTIVAGLFLFLSVSFAGVWLARSGPRRSHKVIAVVLLGVAVLSAAAIITRANAGPPGYVRWAGLPKALSEGRSTSGGLDIEIMPDTGYNMKLIVPIRKTEKSKGEE